MYNRYQGNTGQVRRVDDGRPAEKRPAPPIRPSPPPAQARPQPPARPSGRPPGLMEQLGQLLPGSREPLETEDLILLLILYLLYRESGDSELLMIMGGMFLL